MTGTAQNPASAPVTEASREEASRNTSQTASATVAAIQMGTRKRSGMKNIVRRCGAGFPYRVKGSVDVREDELLAEEWGCKVGTAHQRKIRAMADVVAVITVKRRIQANESLAGYIRPIENATAAAPQPDARHREAVAEAEVRMLEERYRVDPCEATARPLLRKRAALRQAALDLDRERAAEWGITL